MKYKGEHNRNYSLRKLSVGLASVMIGTTFVLQSQTAKASESDNHYESISEVVTNNNVNGSNHKIDVNNSLTTSNAISPKIDTPDDAPSSVEEDNNPLVPVEVAKGQTPDAKSAIPDWNYYSNALSPDDPSNLKVEWDKVPDTSKVGQTTGKIKITGSDQDYETGQSKDISKVVDVPVTIFDSTNDYLNDYGNVSSSSESTDNVVKNTIKYYDVINKKIIRTDRLRGYENSQTSEYPYNIETALGNLGYDRVHDTPYANGADWNNLGNFSDHDQYFTIFVKPKDLSSIDDTHDTNYDTTPKLKPLESDTRLAWDKDVDPAWFVDNLGYLPKGTKIEWETKPEFDFKINHDKDYPDDDNFENPMATNKPSIKVTIPGQDPVILNLEDQIGNPTLALGLGPDYFTIKGDIKVEQGSSLNAADAIDYTGNKVNLNKNEFKNITWSVMPNFSRVGYSYGHLNAELADGGLVVANVLVNVIPKQNKETNTGDVVVDEKNKNEIIDTPTKNDPEPVTEEQTDQKTNEQKSDQEPVEVKKDKKVIKTTDQILHSRRVSKKKAIYITNENLDSPKKQSKPCLPQTGESKTSYATTFLGLASILGALTAGIFTVLKKNKF